ncbi:DUF2141 domain-containing protein [Novosphingobium sp. FSW06-99]|uniref:DUF2141 domain-containing protein n=1 Tax=Novosphingobium sp. FSW06-99 TaxID=1739113 RepID=UPI00076C61C3|nr:DUF2141 domain-containing protein [Novosphingobium sp. FSW06-99]KUR74329.1 hypothetical protein AQZ49_18670 [Novosphingobium sp. FSW06-99]
MIRPLLLAATFPLMTAAFVPSSPDLGTVEARCRADEAGPAVIVDVIGLKDHEGKLKVEVYPGVEGDFLEDDNKLINAGKTFRRVEGPVPGEHEPHICVRLPGPGRYAVMVLHDRDSNHRFNWQHDGVGFSRNPHLGWSKPKADSVAITVGSGVTPLRVIMNYRIGLFSFGPIASNR